MSGPRTFKRISRLRRRLVLCTVTALTLLSVLGVAGFGTSAAVTGHPFKPHFNQVWEHIWYHDGFVDAHSNSGGDPYRHSDYSGHVHDPNGYAVPSIRKYVYIPPCLSRTGEGQAIQLVPYYNAYPDSLAASARPLPPVLYPGLDQFQLSSPLLNGDGDITAQPHTATSCGSN